MNIFTIIHNPQQSMIRFKITIITILCIIVYQSSHAIDLFSNNIKYSCSLINDSCVQIKSWKSSLKTIVLPGKLTDKKGKSYKVLSVDAYKSGYNYLAKTVILEEGIEEINSRCFNCFHSLDSVSLPESLVKIGSNAFDNMSSYKKMSIPTEKIKSLLVESGIPYVNLPDPKNTGPVGKHEELQRLEKLLKLREQEIEQEKKKTEEAEVRVSLAIENAQKAQKRADEAQKRADEAYKKTNSIEEELKKRIEAELSRNNEAANQNASIEEMKKIYNEAMLKVEELLTSNKELNYYYADVKKSNAELTKLNDELKQSNAELRDQLVKANSEINIKEKDIETIKSNMERLSVKRLKPKGMKEAGYIEDVRYRFKDNNDNLYACIKISLAKFDAEYDHENLLDDQTLYKRSGGYDWIFLAKDTKYIKISFKNKEYEDGKLYFNEIDSKIDGLKAGMFYELEVTLE